MQATPMFILYVTDTAASARFYAEALGAPVVYQTEEFAILPIGTGARLGLWKTGTVEPAAERVSPGGAELDVVLADRAALGQLHDRLAGQGARVLQPLSEMDFGTCFTVADPDGHRLRPFVPAAA